MIIVFPLIFRLFPNQKYCSMAIWPFILVKEKRLIKVEKVMNHEKIHLAQQKELLVLPFYIIYLLEYIFYRFSNNHNMAYMKISFEKEAYKNDVNSDYLNTRKLWANFRKG